MASNATNNNDMHNGTPDAHNTELESVLNDDEIPPRSLYRIRAAIILLWKYRLDGFDADDINVPHIDEDEVGVAVRVANHLKTVEPVGHAVHEFLVEKQHDYRSTYNKNTEFMSDAMLREALDLTWEELISIYPRGAGLVDEHQDSETGVTGGAGDGGPDDDPSSAADPTPRVTGNPSVTVPAFDDNNGDDDTRP